MTCNPMDRSSPDDTINTSLHDSNSGLGKAILAIHSKASRPSVRDEASVSVSSFSDAGCMADVSEGDFTSASEYTDASNSDYFSESATEAPSSSMLTADRFEPRPKRRVKRKPKQKEKPAFTSGTTTDTARPTGSSTEAKPIKPRKKPTGKKTKKKPAKTAPGGVLNEEFNTSTLKQGLSMEDFMQDPQTEGETDNDNNTRPARRKRKVKRSVSHDMSSSRLSLKDGGVDSSRNCQKVRRGAETDTDKAKRRTSATPKKHSPKAENSNNLAPSAEAEKPSTTKKSVKKRVSNKQARKLSTTIGPPSKKDKLNEETSFAEESCDGSIQLENLSPLADTVKPKLTLARMEKSTSSILKDASLDLAKHEAAATAISVAATKTAARGGHKNRELMDAISKSNLSVSRSNLGISNAHRGRSLSPGTKRREALEKGKALQQRQAEDTTTNTNGKIKPRRMKSHDGTMETTKKSIRRTKSEGDPDDGMVLPKRTHSKNRRPPKTKANNNSTAKEKVKQRSQSLNLVTHPAIAKNNRAHNNRRRVHASETSPGGTSKVSVSVSVNTMDKSVQSMPSNFPRTGRRASGARMAPPPFQSESNNATTNAVTDKSAIAKSTAKKPVKRASSRESLPRSGTGPKLTAPRKKKPVTNKRATKPTRHNSKSTIKRKNSAESELDEDESIASMDERSQEGSQLTGLITKDSTGCSNLHEVPSAQREKANEPISPFSSRASSGDEGGLDESDDDVYSKSEASSSISGASSMSGVQNSAAPAVSSSLGGLHKALGAKRKSGTPNHLISSYFGREDERDTDPMAAAGESMSGSIAGSLLTDYSSSDNDNNPKTRRGKAMLGAEPMVEASAGELSFDIKGQARMTISPFSAHAGGVASNHTMLATEHTQHTQTPLIPDSDDEESGSFHLDSPKPISSKVGEGPPPTPQTLPKESVLPVTDPVPDEILETPKPKIKQPKIVLPVSTPKPEKQPSKKLTGESDKEFADPVPNKSVAAKSPKSSFWGALCCRNADAVAT